MGRGAFVIPASISRRTVNYRAKSRNMAWHEASRLPWMCGSRIWSGDHAYVRSLNDAAVESLAGPKRAEEPDDLVHRSPFHHDPRGRCLKR